MGDLESGLYDQLIDELAEQQLAKLAGDRLVADVKDVDPAELPDRLAEVIGEWTRQTLASIGSDQRAKAALNLSKAVIDAIGQMQPDALNRGSSLAAPVKRLAAVEGRAAGEQFAQLHERFDERLGTSGLRQ